MKVKTLSALAGVATAMILSSAANAAFTGISFTSAPHAVLAGDPGGGGAQLITTYQIFADFSNAGDTLTSVYGNPAATPGTPLSIEPRNALDTGPGGSFFNNTFGGNSGPNAALFGVSPSLAWDTYVSIGFEPGDAGADPTQFSPGFPAALFTTGVTNQTNMSWFNPVITAGLNQGTHILIGQFSVAAGNNVRGTFGLTFRPSGATSDTFVQNVTFNTLIPAPGALALLGLAGVVGSRRRRA